MSTVRVGGFVYGEFVMTADEFVRRCDGKPSKTVTIKIVDGGWEYTHIGVEPDIDGDAVRFYCDDTTIWAKRRLTPRSER